MAVVVLVRRQPHRAFLVVAGVVLVLAVLVLARATGSALATSSGDPYDVPVVVDTNPDPNVVETSITAVEASVDVGNGVTAHALTFNGSIPGPEFRLKVGDTVIVHFKNDLDEVTGIHWHGIELPNRSDGTPLTQNQVEPGGTYLYKFTVTRPGIYWYHPHHHASTNQVFKGLYGSIIVTDPNEAALQASGALPSAAQTRTLALTDITVCKESPNNDTETVDTSLPHVSGGATPGVQGANPKQLCETAVFDPEGNVIPGPLAAGDVPNVQKGGNSGAVAEGQTLLTNGKNVGGRAGDPSAPGALAAGASTMDVRPGQGLRLQLGNAATTRFFRLNLTDASGTQIPLIRVGGQGGLLNNAVREGGVVAGFDTHYFAGEILLDPGDRADVVAAIPATATGVLTLWTEDFERTGPAGAFAGTPTEPVAHFNVIGSVVAPAYTIAAGTPLRSATGDPVAVLGAATGTLLDPAAFAPVKIGLTPTTSDITLTNSSSPLPGTDPPAGNTLGVNALQGAHDNTGDYASEGHMPSTRYAKLGDVLELTVTNMTGAHHPFHLHGFSIQPIDLTKAASPTFTFAPEFVDNIDVPGGYTLRFRIKLEDRPLVDGVTLGGGLGRWVFHCHIFFHATFGMISELDVVAANGNEKPTVDTDAGIVAVVAGDPATMHGAYHDADGDAVTLSASAGTVTDHGDGTFDWNLATTTSTHRELVFITATENVAGKKAQTVFQLEITYEFGGFQSPFPHEKYQAGSTIPLKFTLNDADGRPLPDSDAAALASTCSVRIQFSGGTPSPNCATYSGKAFRFNLQTSKNLVPGTYTITVEVLSGGSVIMSEDIDIEIRT